MKAFKKIMSDFSLPHRGNVSERFIFIKTRVGEQILIRWIKLAFSKQLGGSKDIFCQKMDIWGGAVWGWGSRG